MVPSCRELVWVGRSLRDFSTFPPRITDEFLLELEDALDGYRPRSAKPLREFGGASILELANSDASGTYRVVYTVRIKDVLCVLHAFQKKSSSGIKTSMKDLDTIKQRLAQAEREYGK
jgi:phage-related protein